MLCRGLWKIDVRVEPVGIERLREALEANDWEVGDNLDSVLQDLEEGDDESEGSLGFGIDPTEMEAEMAGMKQAIYGGPNLEEDGDEEVEKLQEMILKMQAVRGKSNSPNMKNSLG